jgi:hypothetical protein
MSRNGPPGRLWSFGLAVLIVAMLAFQPDFGQAALVLFSWGGHVLRGRSADDAARRAGGGRDLHRHHRLREQRALPPAASTAS